MSGQKVVRYNLTSKMLVVVVGLQGVHSRQCHGGTPVLHMIHMVLMLGSCLFCGGLSVLSAFVPLPQAQALPVATPASSSS